MKIAIACDHGGFPYKDVIRIHVQDLGCDVIDLGEFSAQPSDYPDSALKLGRTIQGGQAERGILLCGSGVGVCIAANKITGIYAGVCHDTYSAHQGVEHDAMNVLCLGARVIGIELAKEIVTAFIDARFIGNDPGQERHGQRTKKVREMENSQ